MRYAYRLLNKIKLFDIPIFMIDKRFSRSQKKNTKSIGDAAEQYALDFLISKGLRLVQRQFHCRFGEWDLILRQGELIVFVEVRYKRDTHFCHPEETIDFYKQKRLIRSAEFYLNRFPHADCRLDVVALTGSPPKLNITWIQDAFAVQ